MSSKDGHRCTCTMTRPGSHLEPAEWEQDPWCPTHPDMDLIPARVTELGRENAELRAVVAAVEALADELEQSRRVSGWQTEAAKRTRAALSGAPASLAEVKADVWDEGYERGVRDCARDMEPADNPYRQDGA